MIAKWTLFNSVFAAITAYLVQYEGILGFILAADPTRVTLIIFGIYCLTTLYLGLTRWNANLPAVKFIAASLTSIGLVGTVIGMMLLFNSVNGVDPTNIIEPLFKGMATVLITTLFGIFFNLLMTYQVAFCYQWYPSNE